MAKPTLVVKLSGRLVSPSRPELVQGFANAIRRLVEEGFHVPAVVVGGGDVARQYIAAGRSVGLRKPLLDLLGIEAARLNARLLAYTLGDLAYPEPPRSLWEAVEASSTGRIIVAGGFQPGQSTATVAALLAEALGADLLLLGTRVDGVYDRDPERHPDARLIERLSYRELLKVVEQSVEPGKYELLDTYAVSILERSGIATRVFNASNPANIVEAARGRIGSLVTPSRG